MANERHTDHRGWEVDSSTRQSVHSYTKYDPFREALSTTASTLKTLAQGEIATNWVTNPSIEGTDVGMFTATGSAIARDTGQYDDGAASLSVNPDDSDAGEGFYWDSPTIPFSTSPQHITIQCTVRGASASGAVTMTLRDSAGTSTLATGGSHSLTTSYARQTAQYTIPALTDGASYRLYVATTAQHNIDFNVDKIMFEVREDTTAVSTYLDGNQGINYEWTGTANLSTSVKKADMSVLRGIQIKNESSSSGEIVYVAFDCTATATTGIPILAGETFETNYPLDFRKSVSVISASGTPTVKGVMWGIAGY